MAITPLQDYEKASNRLAKAFLKALYPDDPEYYDDWYWIADDIGGVLVWGVWCVDPNKMADFFRYNYTSAEFFEWYDQPYVTGLFDGKSKVSMRNFKKNIK